MKTFLKEVEDEIKKLANKEGRESDEKFAIPRSVGVSSCKLRPRLKQGFSFSCKSENEQWKIWEYIYKNSRLFEAQMAALRFAEDRTYTNGLREWKIVKTWVDHIDNWAHSDVLSKIYSFLYERHPETIEPTLRKWNKDKNPWKQRASVVSTIYYASKNRKAPPLKFVFELVEPLIYHKDPYVQKGVGWQLREAYNLYPKQTLAFLKKHNTEFPATVFSYATEKLSKDVKQKLKAERKVARTK